LSLAGCSSHHKHDESGDAQASSAMMCPKCETVWIRQTTQAGPKVSVLHTTKGMVCPDCDAMAKSQLMEDGKVKLHECPECKVTPMKVSPIQPTHEKGTHS